MIISLKIKGEIMKDLSTRLKLNYDMMKVPYPVMGTCPYCNRRYAPVSYLPSGDKYTICCHHIIDRPVAVVGYVTLVDLEETEWDTEL